MLVTLIGSWVLTALNFSAKQEPIIMVPLSITPTAEVDFSQAINAIPLDRISAYNPVPRQTDASPDISSCGPNLSRQVALSRDIFFDNNGRKHLCGRQVIIITDRGERFKGFTVNDTMNARYTNTVDIMFDTEDESTAWAFGVTRGMLIFLD